jgi:type I restriction enzyme S subunit
MEATASSTQVERFSLRGGDTIVTKDSETADDIAVSSYVPLDLPGVVCGYHLSIVRPFAGTHGAFVKRLFDSSYAKSTFAVLANGLTRVALGQYELDNIELPVPPYAEQVILAAFLDRETEKIERLIDEQSRLIALLSEKRQAVISHAVTSGLNSDAPLKPSGIPWLGYVPAHWRVVGLTKYLASLVDYRGRTPNKVVEGVFLVTARNIRNGRIDYEASEEYIEADEYEDVMRRGKPAHGDVLFTTEAPLGGVANVDRTDVALAQRIIKFSGRADALDNYFLKYWLLGSFAQADMHRLATGSTALGIKGSKVGQLRMCLPPLPEQVSIVRYLDQRLLELDSLSAEVQRAIDLLLERRSVLISAAVTGKIDVRELANSEAA